LSLHLGQISRQISIHAPREGGDIFCEGGTRDDNYFNPRPPRGGRRISSMHITWRRYFNPRPPRGGRR